MASARPRPPRRLLRQVKQATPAIHSTRPLCHGSSHDPSGRRLSPRYRNRTDGATRAITSTRTCGNTNAGLDQPRPTVALLAKLETQRVVGSPAAVVAQLGVALRREPGCDAGAVEAAAEALADRLTRAGSKHRGAAAPVTEQVPARALRALEGRREAPGCAALPTGLVSSRRHIEPCMRFSRTRLTDVLHRRHSVGPA